jgi:3-hydroxyisobutyrate dehydrogenase-like beta-hydroxyacid dehydrogenase
MGTDWEGHMNDVIGVAGCGTMGLAMARQAAAAGFEVWGHDVRPAEAFGDFAPRMVGDRATFAERCDTVLSMVMNLEQTEDLLFGEAGLFTGPRPPTRLVVSSTLSHRALPGIASRLPAGTALVDAPVAGSHIGAEAGTLTFMVGGADDDVGALMPLLEAMGATVHHVGPLGAGLTCKVVNNFIVVACLVAVRKGLATATARGVDEAAMRAVLATSSGDTWYGRNLDAIDWGRLGYQSEHRDNALPILEKDLSAFIDALEGLAGPAAGAFEAALMEALRAQEPLP